MTIQQLKVFLTVCENMNYSKAAEQCYISRQALRQNIAALEKELNGPLFDNTSNHISLTELGVKLLNECKTVVDSFDRLTDTMNSYIDQRSIIRVAVSNSLVPHYIPGLKSFITKYAELHPDITIEVTDFTNDEIAPLINNGIIDCGFVMDLGISCSGIVRTEITSHSLAITTPSNMFKNKCKGTISLHELQGMTINIPGKGIEFSPLLNAIDCDNLDIDIRVTADYYKAYYNVRENNELVLNRTVSNLYNKENLVDTFSVENMPCICCAAITSSGEKSPQISKFIEFIKSRIPKI